MKTLGGGREGSRGKLTLLTREEEDKEMDSIDKRERVKFKVLIWGTNTASF